MLRKPDQFVNGRSMNKPTTEPHLEADAETGLHDLTHRLIGEVGSHWGQQQRPQHLQRTAPICTTLQ